MLESGAKRRRKTKKSKENVDPPLDGEKRRARLLSSDAVDHKIRRNDTKYEVKHQTERKNGGNPEVSGHWGKLQVPPIPDPNQPDSNIGHNYLRGNAVRSHENSKLKRKLNGYCQHL
ncbi:uncharacterized protein LOC116620173 isoform X2 [Nematostella vectensis]|uniref:uncharacterized protein LOC116620173 isoform X2 n=1 Tax=Nematostella vectensis TaxID=45351 RepID=UPI002076D776|nr:uncharacterized protein LOC116620173 isoform X2 [Nematostella vectensis]